MTIRNRLSLLLCAAALSLGACGSDPASPSDLDGGDTGTGGSGDASTDIGGTTDTAGPDADPADTTPGPDAGGEDTSTGPDASDDDTSTGPDAGGEDTSVDTSEPDIFEADTAVEPDTAPTDTGSNTDTGPVGDFDPPDETGSIDFDDREANVPRPGGGGFGGPRPIEMDIYLPETDGPAPIVILSHGFQLNGGQYKSYGEHLASHGFVAVLPTYGDGITNARTHVELADDLKLIIDWLITQNTTANSPYFGKLDTSRIGAGGHSRGGKTTLLQATRDTRIKASFNLDPVDAPPPSIPFLPPPSPTDYPSVAPELMDELEIPVAFIGAGRGVQQTLGQSCAPADNNFQQYYDAAVSPAYLYRIDDAGHLDFADSCGLICATCTAGANPGEVRAFSRATMVAFYKYFLLDDERFLPWVSGNEIDASIFVYIK